MANDLSELRAPPGGPAGKAEAAAGPRASGRRASRLGRWPWLVLAVAVGASGAGYYWGVPILLGRSVKVIRLAPQPLVQTVVASGRIVTPNRVEVGSQVTGTVASVKVEEGQTVGAGDPLVVLDDTEARSGVAQAESAVAQAAARLRQLRELALPAAEEALKQAEANLANAEAAFARAERLHRSGFITQALYDDAKMKLAVAETQARSAELQVETNTASGGDYALAETALAQAEATLQASRAKLAYTLVRAPSRSVVIARSVEPGDVVQPGKALLVLAPIGATQIVIQIDEKNLALLKPGQSALASADAYADQTFPATVETINPAVDPQRGSVEVKLAVPTPPGYLREDMTVSVDIEVARRDAALLLPAEALRSTGTDGTWVMVAVDGRAVQRSVRLGAREGGKVEIVDGLVSGDLVIPTGDSTIAVGQKIRPQPE